MSKKKEMELSDQALGALMMSLQKSLMEQSDIVPVLKGLKFRLSEDGLVVMNPPLIKFDDEFEENLQEGTSQRLEPRINVDTPQT